MNVTFIYQGDLPERLDRVVLGELQRRGNELLTRSQVERAIESGRVTVSGAVITKAGIKVKPGTKIVCEPFETAAATLVPCRELLPILYEDEAVLVIDKPAGISMHPGAGTANRTIAQMVLGHLERSGWADPERPGIVHRLDKDTTGVVVVARTVAVHAALAEQFASHSVGREYRGLVLSRPRKRAFGGKSEGTLTTKIRRSPKDRRKMEIVPSSSATPGRSAVTNWSVDEWMEYAALCSFRLQTGRTHQIRAHLTSIGAPLIGDPTYRVDYELPRRLAQAALRFGRQALHAWKLEFEHPIKNVRMKFTSALPDDFKELLKEFRSYGE